MDAPLWPAFLLDGGDIAVIDGPSDLARKLEPFLASQPVEFYDALGRRLRLVVEGSGRSETVRLGVESDERYETRLRSAITEYLNATGRAVPMISDLAAFATTAAKLTA